MEVLHTHGQTVQRTWDAARVCPEWPFVTWHAPLIGVDLSPHMIAKAKQRSTDDCCCCYDELVVGDLTTILDVRPYSDYGYDLVFSCDVFVYLGDLNDIFIKVHKSLAVDGDNRGGIFAFSTELLAEGSSCKKPYMLQDCGRFAHKKSYITSLARDCGFQVLNTQSCTIRKNKGRNVMGLLAVLRKMTR